MTLAAIKIGDIVFANKRGIEFYALVTGKEQRKLEVHPITANVNHFQLKATEVIRHYSKRGRS